MTQIAIRRLTLMAAAVILMAAGNRPSLAASESPDDYRVISDKFTINLGSYITDFKTDAAIGSGGVVGTFFRVEDDLGIDEDDRLLRVEGLYRFNRRHSMSFAIWSVNRDGVTVLSDQLNIDGTLFDVDAAVASEFDTTWLRIDWRYSFLRTDRGEAGVSGGLTFYKFEVAVAGEALVDDGMGGTFSEFARAGDDLVAPIPTVGFFINHGITPNLVFRFSADFFNLDIDDYEGSMVTTSLMLEWYFSRHAGIGGGITGSDLDFKFVGENPFTVDFRQTGLVGYFTFAFGEVD